MTIEFKLPEVSEGVESVDIAEIMVARGDVIDAGAIVCEVETDKAVAEIECPHAGKIQEILVSEGDSVSIGTPLLLIEETAAAETPPATNNQPVADEALDAPEGSPPPAAAPADESSSPTGIIDFSLQEVSEGVTAVDVAEVLVAVGDVIQSGAIICEVETDKAVAEIECPHAGTITAVHISEGSNIKIGAPLISIETSSTADNPAAPPVKAAPPSKATAPAQKTAEVTAIPTPKSATAVNTSQPPPPAGPATRRLARKLGVDLTKVPGSARGGRIIIEDVEAFVRTKLSEPSGSGSVSPGLVQAAALPDSASLDRLNANH
jgi:pyruvate dehydrogenase E2 component (dihydrolipoamide acetyltransferase)